MDDIDCRFGGVRNNVADVVDVSMKGAREMNIGFKVWLPAVLLGITLGVVAKASIRSALANFMTEARVFVFGIDAANQGTSKCAQPLTECPASVIIDTTGTPLLTQGNPGWLSLIGALPSGANVLGGVTQSGVWDVGIAGTLPLPTGAATSVLQTMGNTELTAINTTLGAPMQNSGGNVGLTGTLPSFASPPTVEQGTTPWIIGPEGVTSTVVTAAPTPGTFSTLLAANGSRKGCLIQNVGTTLGYIYPGPTGSATLSNSLLVGANGGTLSCDNHNATVLQDNIAGTCGFGTCDFVIVSQ
jgi:hypothetical protein